MLKNDDSDMEVSCIVGSAGIMSVNFLFQDYDSDDDDSDSSFDVNDFFFHLFG